MLAPTNKRQLKMFLGMIIFYRGLWPRRSHILVPPNKLVRTKSKKDWQWTEIEQAAFLEAKSMLKKETLLHCAVLFPGAKYFGAEH